MDGMGPRAMAEEHTGGSLNEQSKFSRLRVKVDSAAKNSRLVQRA